MGIGERSKNQKLTGEKRTRLTAQQTTARKKGYEEGGAGLPELISLDQRSEFSGMIRKWWNWQSMGRNRSGHPASFAFKGGNGYGNERVHENMDSTRKPRQSWGTQTGRIYTEQAFLSFLGNQHRMALDHSLERCCRHGLCMHLWDNERQGLGAARFMTSLEETRRDRMGWDWIRIG
ncbi:hypothetical protein NW757_009637 [Fusarium falciforme]|nr:hypothetical protein NW757_009637 [Fusarium falciforme]